LVISTSFQVPETAEAHLFVHVDRYSVIIAGLWRFARKNS
jgi:hypothetical protein